MNKKGFTVIELLIVFAILTILITMIGPAWIGYKNKDDNITQGQAIVRESKQEEDDGSECKGGYKFIFTDGKYIQVMSSSNGGVPCSN